MTPPSSSQAFIHELVRSTGASDPPSAMRQKAVALIATYVASFGEPERPVNIEILASLRGITRSDDAPLHSADAEIAPDGQGGVTMRVNPDRPLTRQRFSMAHEIAHTFFPEYEGKTWCRPNSRYRERSNPDDYIEMLCDRGAAELLFPQPWFGIDAATVTGAAALVDLADAYAASREATLRRYAETSSGSLAVAFFSWKLKPTQKGIVGREAQGNLFGITPEDEIRGAIRLRIDYSIASPAFKRDGHFLPNDKSVESTGPIYDAASRGTPAQDDAYLDLGQAAGIYRVWAVPLWTPNDELGPKGENAVAAVLCPITVRKPPNRKGRSYHGPTLFDDTCDFK